MLIFLILAALFLLLMIWSACAISGRHDDDDEINDEIKQWIRQSNDE